MPRAQSINRFFHSRLMLVTVAMCTVAVAIAAYGRMGASAVPPGDRGLLFDSANLWLSNHTASFIINLAVCIGIALLKIIINRAYSMQKTVSLLDASLFLAMCTAMPVVMVALTGGTVLCTVLLLCMALLFGCYNDRRATRRVFAIFVILSAMATTQYCYLLYIVVFAIGCVQMRIFDGRTLTAMVLGIVTPWWILLGTGLVPLSQLHAPDFDAYVQQFSIERDLPQTVTLGFMMLLLAVSWVVDFGNMIAFNAHRRARSGFVIILSLATAGALCVDFANARVYALTFFLCVSYQASQMFVFRLHRGRWMMPAFLFVIFACLCALNLTLT